MEENNEDIEAKSFEICDIEMIGQNRKICYKHNWTHLIIEKFLD